MKPFKYILFFLLFLSARLWATHNRAGEITYKWIGGTTFEITITTYTKLTSQADRCELVVYFGDGDTAIFKRINGPHVICGSQVGDGEPVDGDIKKNIYKGAGAHTYPGPGTYSIWMQDPNRVEYVKNIVNSVNVPFALKTTLIINPLLGSNSSPVLLNPPIDNACQGACFYHNPGAYDPDGDSLSYKLTTCLGINGTPVSGYSLPATSGTFFIDAVTGDLEWCSPVTPGIYNVAMVIEEWRAFNGKSYLIGNVLRDMQIDVKDNCNNQPPVANVSDTCIEAGKFLTFSVTAVDPDGDYLTLSASGGPLSSVPAPKAVFSNVNGVGSVSGPFKWQTSCDHIRKQPYMVTFKAADTGPPSLVYFETVKITVVAPAPKNPSATPLGTSMKIKWDKSICNPVNNIFTGYKIYRRSGPSGWNPSYCETGVPGHAGYALIGTLNIVNGYSINDTSFTDSDNGTGLIQGVTYCYRIVACFSDGAESYASVEVCAELKKDVPIITNVDVVSTGTNDTIFIKWVKPVANAANFDTIEHPGPYTFELYQSSGFNVSHPILIKTYTSPTFKNWTDTTYISTGLNTRDSAYSYRVNLYAQNNADTLGFSHIASSVYLSLTPSDNQLTLSWQANVPWSNNKYFIYKNIPPATTYDLYDSTITSQYIDASLVNGATYCYYILAKGVYSDPTLPTPLLNRSEKICGAPVDLIVPCPPQLLVSSDCSTGTNTLIWNNPNNFCTDDVVKYNIYYTPMQTDPFSLLLTVTNVNDTTYTYSNTHSIAGCFLVTAVDSFNNESINGNMFCVDNCPVYKLPNVFTPDGDGANDFFVPLLPYRYIKDIDLKIFNRWGQLMYETTDPNINWNGKNIATGQDCSDGTYYYVCIVNEIRVYGIQPREIKGFLQLITGKNSGPNK